MQLIDAYAPTVETYFLDEDMAEVYKLERVIVFEDGGELHTATVAFDHFVRRRVFKEDFFPEQAFNITDGIVDETDIDCAVQCWKEEVQNDYKEDIIFQLASWGVKKMRKWDEMNTIVPIEAIRK